MLVGASGAAMLFNESQLTSDTEDVVLVGVSAISATAALWRGSKLLAATQSCFKSEASPSPDAVSPVPPTPPVAPGKIPLPGRVVQKAKNWAIVGLAVLPWAGWTLYKYMDGQQRERIDDPAIQIPLEPTSDGGSLLPEHTQLDQIVW